MRLSVLRARPAACLLRLFLLSITSCTSLQWQSADGTLHEVGLVLYSVEQRGESFRVERISFGATLRLSGPDPGYCVGIYDSALIVPEYSTHASADDLAESVARYLEKGGPATPARKSYGFFALSHPRASKAIEFRSSQLGVGISLRERGGIVAGMEECLLLTGPARDRDAVQIVVHDPERPELWDARAWALDEQIPLRPH